MNKESEDNVVWSCPEHSLDTYFKVKQFEQKPEAKDFVYVRFAEGDKKESMWIKILKGTQQRGHGKINNIPVHLIDRKFGDIINYKTDKEGITWVSHEH